ncbi:MAG TPA: YchF-related putative GTPase [Thermoplasmataceae archaeon]|nr:YchF-related putative GTPase [Thermoplasmataceae archaeon]
MSIVKIGLIGKPNAGKSTLFSALTHNTAEIANYPFTTIKPNVGIALFPAECPEKVIGKKCSPREGMCRDGTRYIPIEVIDVPGLIPGASEGKGMGNEFLENIRDSDAIIHVFDASGTSQLDGTPSEEKLDPLDEINFVRKELYDWFSSKLSKDWDKFSRKEDASKDKLEASLMKKLTGYGIDEKGISEIILKGSFPDKLSKWTEENFSEFTNSFFTYAKPILYLANKADLCSPEEVRKISESLENCIFSAGEYELAIQKAFSSSLISSDSSDFQISGKATEKQKAALEKIRIFLANDYVERPQNLLEHVVRILHYIVVYPVYDETHWTDKNGNILPDAIMMKEGQNALDLAFRVHTEIGKGFIKAIDGRTKMVISKEHVLKEGDVIRIVAKTK